MAMGGRVAKGQALLTPEAMKIEYALTAPFDAEVEAVLVSAGHQVSEGVALARLKVVA